MRSLLAISLTAVSLTIVAPTLADDRKPGPPVVDLGGKKLFVAALGRVPLGCSIVGQKVLTITNTSGGVIPSGTTLTYDAVLLPTQQHESRGLRTGSPLPVGAALKTGVPPAASCTAWFKRKLLMLAPSN